MEKTDNNKAVNMLTEVEQADSDSYEGLTVEKANTTIVKKGKPKPVESKDRERRDSEIKAAIKKINMLLASNMNGSYGFVLNSRMISLGGDNADADGFIEVGIVLGEGSSGEVIIVQDRVTKEKVAYKAIPDSEFNGDGIRAWVRMADKDMAPELYHFRRVEGKVEFSMEPLAGMTLKQATDCLRKQDPRIREQLSLWVLYELLEIRYKLQPFSHGDIHAGNVYLENSMTVKLIDFDSAKNSDKLSDQDTGMAMRKDLVDIICTLYPDFDLNAVCQAKKQPAGKDLSKLSDSFLQHIPEDSCKQLFEIMLKLCDPKQADFGDTSRVAADIKLLLPEDLDKFKKKVADILFIEKYQIQVDGVDCDDVDDHGSDNFTPGSLDGCFTLKCPPHTSH